MLASAASAQPFLSTRVLPAPLAGPTASWRRPTPRVVLQPCQATPIRDYLASAACGIALAASLTCPGSAWARPEGVNRPDLLPKGPEVSTVIDVAGFLTPSEEKRVAAEIASLERDTGFKLRLLAQNYPETPGLAIRDYWGVDDSTIVFVADPSFGSILNFNCGQLVDLEVPRSFWSRLAGQYGNQFYWKEKGENEAILNAVSAIDTCLREPQGKFKCSKIQAEFGEKDRGGVFEKALGL